MRTTSMFIAAAIAVVALSAVIASVIVLDQRRRNDGSVGLRSSNSGSVHQDPSRLDEAVTNDTLPHHPSMALFRILTSLNNIMVGDLREDTRYYMPKNVQICREALSVEELTAEYLTN